MHTNPLTAQTSFDHMKPHTGFEHCAQNYGPINLNLRYGEGPYLIGNDGTVYIDFIGGYGAVMFGHRHPRIVATIEKQIASQKEVSAFLQSYDFAQNGAYKGDLQRGGLDLTTRNFTYPLLGEYTTKLAAFSRIPDAVVLPKNGGGEIIESAVKAMRGDGVRRRGIPNNQGKIIVFSRNFHGRTSSAMAASTNPKVKQNFGPFIEGFISVTYGDIEALKAVMDKNKGFISGVLMEPIQGEAGVLIPPAGYLKAVQTLCKDYNAVLCLDEIQSGMGRTGKRWAWEHDLDEAPDMIVTAKALGAGIVASSALIGKREIIDGVFTPGSDGATMSGSPLTCAVGLEAMAILDEEHLCAAGIKIGEHLKNGLTPLLDSPMIKDIRIRGAWGGIELTHDDYEFTKKMATAISNYLTTVCRVVCTPAYESIRLSPPLTMPLAYVDRAAELIIETIALFENNPDLVTQYTFST
jgi:ornithine--oxo-acid transaminase